MVQEAWATLQSVGEWVVLAIGHVDWLGLFENKIARALGMLVLVWAIIWIIALVYSGYAQDSELGPVGLRPHGNRRLGESAILFDQSIYPFQMDGVEATCRVFYVYEDRDGNTRKIDVSGKQTLKIHIRATPMSRDSKTRYGFEIDDELGALEQTAVTYPTFEAATAPEFIPATPENVKDYIQQNQLEEKWTEDDEAPIISIGSTLLELITEARKDHILQRAEGWRASQIKSFIANFRRTSAVKARAGVFGSYYVKLQFSKAPEFVLFRHPNKELKMTAWLTVLTSVFSLAMDLWPVDVREPVTHPSAEHAQSHSASHRIPIGSQ